MLDTDSVSFAMRGDGGVGRKILQHRPQDLFISALTLCQLRHGATRRNSAKLHVLIDVFLRDVAVLPFDEECANRYAEVASDLARRGTPIGEFDTLIAAHALTFDLILVTNNVKHFRRVRGLEVENWL
jgi:tRNA(fMet)-specific endonuclease VapC